MLTAYDRWVRERRPAKVIKPLDRPIDSWAEEECLHDREPGTVGTIILNNGECPFSCLMCGYWRDTTDETPREGLVAGQVRWAISRLPPLRSVKLYNCGNFFDPNAIPSADIDEIAGIVRRMDLVVVECHPALVGPPAVRFARSLDGRLEVAMGLEVAHVQILALLNKKMSLGMFRRAAEFLRGEGILVKAFILVKPPFLGEAEALRIGRETVDFARQAGVDAVALIPTVTTPGAMEEIGRKGYFRPPHLRTLYEVARYALESTDLRVLVDLWDFDNLARCDRCRPALREAFLQVNRYQRLPELACECVGEWEDLLLTDRVRSWKEFREEARAPSS